MGKTHKAIVSESFKSLRKTTLHWINAKEELKEAGINVGKKVPKPSSGKYKSYSEKWHPPENALMELVVPNSWKYPSREEVWLLESLIKEKWPNADLKYEVKRWMDLWKVRATIESLKSLNS